VSTRKQARGFPHWIVGALVMGQFLTGLSGCQTRPPPPAERGQAPAPAPVQPPAVPADAREYKVVGEESLLQILVYRGGAMARLGHNHVIASHHLEGEVLLSGDATQTRFEIRVPVDELTIDEPDMRESAGADFPPGVPQSARDGTRKNLLSEALLDGANYPQIRLRATDVALGADGGFDVGVEVTLKDQAYQVRVPVTLQHQEGAVIASGEFALKQSELGLKPFSVAMGTLVVLDEMKIRFQITAREPQPE
jgi:polyisoprenoid-binding protein YceI